MLELCLMYVASKVVRDNMSIEAKISKLKENMNSAGFVELLESLKGYIHTIDTRIMEGSSGETLATNNH